MGDTQSSAETRLTGLPVSGGVAFARVCLFNERRHSNLPIYRTSGEGIEREKSRLHKALEVAGCRLDTLIRQVGVRVGSAEAEIFKAQKMILADPGLLEQMLHHIDTDHQNAEVAVARVLEVYESRLLEVDDQYIKERASDIGEIKRRLLDVLGNMKPSLQCGAQAHCQRGKERIIVAEELTPSLAVELDAAHTRGLVTAHGGPTSHAAILARALGIPAVCGIKDIHSRLGCGTELLVDGNTGDIIVWPTEETLADRKSATGISPGMTRAVEPVPGFTVMADINLAVEVGEAVRTRAEGIGLYRTEFEFFTAGRLLSEEEHLDHYVSVLGAMKGRPVHFRLLDVGGDKGASFFDLPKEDNPFLGCRGGRLLVARPELWRAQARALARASNHGPVHVLYPMVLDVEQFLELRQLFHKAVADIRVGQIRHGVMFEVPSACLQARELLEVADFASIGTNDLIQYLFAVDRNNEHVAHDYVPDKPVIWSLMRQIAKAALDLGRPLSVCGEVAGNPRFLPKLVQAGITTVSVSPRLIAGLRLAASDIPLAS